MIKLSRLSLKTGGLGTKKVEVKSRRCSKSYKTFNCSCISLCVWWKSL